MDTRPEEADAEAEAEEGKARNKLSRVMSAADTAGRRHLHNSRRPDNDDERPLWMSPPASRPVERRRRLQPLVAATGLERQHHGRPRGWRATILMMQIAAMVAILAKEATGQQQQQQDSSGRLESEPPEFESSLFVDAKVWLGNTEFGERANWRAGRKPCSLQERVAIGREGLVVSLGDFMDSISTSGAALEAVRELALAQDGMLLLEEDTWAVGARDPAYLAYLNQSGDCLDSSWLPEEEQQGHWFVFEPAQDQLSWFNPRNWHSTLQSLSSGDGPGAAHLMPEANQVPCAEDLVLFGSRAISPLFALEEPEGERARLLTFKVNFRASYAWLSRRSTSASSKPPAQVGPVRVARLKIGERLYTQAEFDQLAQLYGNRLFQFQDDELSALSDDSASGPLGANPRLIIDESSIRADGLAAVCQNEPGCECGNEQAPLMELICSFGEPLEARDMPCRDPIQAPGYCNKICGASLSINMDPVRFSERYLVNLVNKAIQGDEAGEGPARPTGYFLEHLFAVSRRTDHNKYEVTFRLATTSDPKQHAHALGKDRELAQLVRELLEKPATKSFYGIKTINLRASLDWRQNNRGSIFMIAMLLLLPLALTLFAKFDDQLTELVLPLVLRTRRTTSCSDHFSRSSVVSGRDETLHGAPTMANDVEQTTGEAADNLAMVDLDANSAMGSTLNLLAAVDGDE